MYFYRIELFKHNIITKHIAVDLIPIRIQENLLKSQKNIFLKSGLISSQNLKV